MKKCPFCKAEIEENARFCLYCMTPLEEKQEIKTSKDNSKRRLYCILAAVLAVAFVISGIFILTKKEMHTNYSSDSSAAESITSNGSSNTVADSDSSNKTQSRDESVSTQPHTADSDKNNTTVQSSSESVNGQPSATGNGKNNTTTQSSNASVSGLPSATGKGNNTTTAQSSNASVISQPVTADNSKNNNTTQSGSYNSSNNSLSTNGSSSQSSTVNNSAPQSSTSNNVTPPEKEDESSNQNSTQNNTDSSDTTDTSAGTNTTKYEYITATIENAYPTDYGTIHAPENAIVITKVSGIQENGNYVIPDTVDGKKVAAIMPSAFSEVSASVKSVTLPSSVKTIWSDAFKDCFNLTDLYIKSAVIGIYEDAFPNTSKRTGILTFHCSRECMNFDFYYYRNIADNYGAEYAEWNG